jgi:alkylation response protein AidB-like acyl-CoA dehydrogenase
MSDGVSLDDLCEGFERFLEREVDRRHEEHAKLLDDPMRRYDERGRFRPEILQLIREVREASAAAGFYTMTLPASVGGAAIGWEGLFRVWEVDFRHCGATRWLGHHAIAHWTKGPNPLLAELAPEVRNRYLPSLAAGVTSMCFAMSEPDAGSDSWMMRTRADPVEGGWRLNGSKQWISNGAHADVAIVFAVTDPDALAARRGGVGAFVVSTDEPGFVAAEVAPMFGQGGSNEATLHLDDVFVPDDHVIGDPTRGFDLAMRGVGLGRLYNCAKAVGLARWAFESTVAYVKERRTFGAPLADHQALAFTLADDAVALHSARLVALDTARLLDGGGQARKELAMAKVAATEAAVKVIDDAMQLHGAIGFTNELGLAEAWHMARAARVADGTSEILRRQIANRILAGDVDL